MFGLKARRAERARLVEALAWYATTDNWKRPTTGRSWKNSPAGNDRGARARAALRSPPVYPVTVPAPADAPRVRGDDVE